MSSFPCFHRGFRWLVVAGGLLISGLSSGQVVFSDDFTAAAGATLAGRVPPVGQAWTQPGGAAITITNGAIDTAGGDRSAFAGFSQAFTGSPRLLKLTIDFTSLTFSSGYAGVSLYSGDSEKMFVGSVGGRGGSVSCELTGGGAVTATPATPTGLVTVIYDSETGKTTLYAGATLTGPVLGSLTGTAGLSLDRVRVQNGGADVGVSSITAEMLAQGPLSIDQFETDAQITQQGNGPFLYWQVGFADSVSISPGIGAVESNGDQPLTLPLGDTTYQLTAVAGAVTKQASTTVRSVVGGVVSYRYLQYKTKKTRSGGIATQLAELNFYRNGTRVAASAVTNPGGSNPSAAEDFTKVIDGDFTTKWLDSNGAPLIFDFGTQPVSIDGYSFVAANDDDGKDPVNWTFEGSNDGVTWTLVDNVMAFDYDFSRNRQAESIPIPFPGVTLFPVASLQASATTLVTGDALYLGYDASGAQTAKLSDVATTTTLAAASGVLTLHPTATTSYTLTSTAANGKVSTRKLDVAVISPAVSSIAYSSFDPSGNELALLGGAAVLNDHLLRPLPADAKRLRLTGEVNGQNGTAWFRKRQVVGAGFDTTFDMQISRTDGAIGADGLGLVIQNASVGSDLPVTTVQNALVSKALVIAFDTYSSGGAGLRVGGNGTQLVAVDLTTVQGLTLRSTGRIQDLTGQGAPYRVHVTYLPGSLTISVDNVVVVDQLNVDLASLGAVDASGSAYVGFSASTGGLSEAHDITAWTLTSGSAVTPDLKIVSSSFDLKTGQATLVWQSAAGKTYRITSSTDLSTWSEVVAGIAGSPGQTSSTFSFAAAGKRFFRVEQQ
ncbi:MAG: symbB [Akkermansiaceae bacterium]|nr:symbB [Akkermansiaceae bacterium]